VEKRGAYRVFVRKSQGDRPLGRPTQRLYDYIKMDLQEIGQEGMDWIDLTQDRNRCWLL
jgi:hypothetical protein